VVKEGKGAIKWTRLSCRTFAANVRLQLHALAYNLGNFLRTLATPEPIKDWSLMSLKEKLIKIGAKVVCRSHHQRQREARDCHAFTSNRREECVQMPAKIARLATRPPFWIPEVSVAVRSSRPFCSKAEKREYSWQIDGHPGNPGSTPFFPDGGPGMIAGMLAFACARLWFTTPRKDQGLRQF
jgi:hypothetical protein